ncbi:MAG: multidrug effflux MFS transporter [Gammaproteobacteria bacterium]|nr:multidrug effflux MFS transporter [Gammaproteobacteria bacterium]
MSAANKNIPVLLLTIILASLSTIAPFTIDTYLPSFPSVATELNASTMQMQQSLSMYMLGFAMMTLFSGAISDALGRRSITLLALFVYAVSSFACSQVNDIDTFLWLRLLQGVAASVGIVIGRAVVRDLYSGAEAQRMMSNVMLFFAMAPAIAPIVGGLLEVTLGWRYIFVFLMLLGLLVFSLVALYLPETLPPQRRHSLHPLLLLKNYIHAMTHLHFTVLALIVAFNFAGFFIYIMSSPQLLFSHLGYAADEFYIMFVPVVLGIMAGSYASARLAGYYPPMKIILAGSLIMLGASVLNLCQAYWLNINALNVIAPIVFYAVGMALTMPALTVMGIDQLPNNKGLASSLQSFMHMGGNAVVAGVVAPLVFDSISGLALTMLSFHAVGLLLFGGVLYFSKPAVVQNKAA